MTSCSQPILTIHFYVTISPTLEHKQDNKKQTELGTKTGVSSTIKRPPQASTSFPECMMILNAQF